MVWWRRKRQPDAQPKPGVEVGTLLVAPDPSNGAALVGGATSLKVAGTYHRQEALRELVGDRAVPAGGLELPAVLVPEPANPHDPNAVAVQVSNVTVGYLSREHAAKLNRRIVERGGAVGVSTSVLVLEASAKGGDRLWALVLGVVGTLLGQAA